MLHSITLIGKDDGTDNVHYECIKCKGVASSITKFAKIPCVEQLPHWTSLVKKVE